MTLKEMKYDGGKPLAGILFQDFSRALMAVSEVATFGANKYERSSWRTVPEALTRYLDAKFRHILKGQTEERDEESGLLHAAHEAWNALATLELMLEAKEKKRQVTLADTINWADFWGNVHKHMNTKPDPDLDLFAYWDESQMYRTEDIK